MLKRHYKTALTIEIRSYRITLFMVYILEKDCGYITKVSGHGNKVCVQDQNRSSILYSKLPNRSEAFSPVSIISLSGGEDNHGRNRRGWPVSAKEENRKTSNYCPRPQSRHSLYPLLFPRPSRPLSLLLRLQILVPSLSLKKKTLQKRMRGNSYFVSFLFDLSYNTEA